MFNLSCKRKAVNTVFYKGSNSAALIEILLKRSRCRRLLNLIKMQNGRQDG